VLSYSIEPNGPALSRESQETIVPGDYGLYPAGTYWYNIWLCAVNNVGYGLDSRKVKYYFSHPVLSYYQMQNAVALNSPALADKVCQFHMGYTTPTETWQSLLPHSIIQEACNRDQQCIFSGVKPSNDSEPLVTTWIFPPFLGYEVSTGIHNFFEPAPNSVSFLGGVGGSSALG
jgi:hypothetical protein